MKLRAVQKFIDELPIFDMSDAPMSEWLMGYPFSWAEQSIEKHFLTRLSKFTEKNAIMFFERPMARVVESQRIVKCVFKHRPLTESDKKFRNQKFAFQRPKFIMPAQNA